MVMSFCAVLFPTRCLDEILNLIESVSEGFPSYSCEQLAKTIADHPADDQEGFILEVDLEYPEDLHSTHNAYPLAPKRMVVQKKWMSE